MQQEIKNEIENWFLSNQEDFSRMFRNNLTNQDIADATNGKYSQLSTSLKEEYDLGIVVKLPEIDDLTELVVSEQTELSSLSPEDVQVRNDLNIKKRANLIVPEFSQQVLPSRSEIQELMEEIQEGLIDQDETTVVY
jgi:hypothetical protein